MENISLYPIFWYKVINTSNFCTETCRKKPLFKLAIQNRGLGGLMEL